MTRDEIISTFHEAGKAAGWKPGVGNKLVINYLTHFAALVAAAEREQCALAAWEVVEYEVHADLADQVAQAIRARSRA